MLDKMAKTKTIAVKHSKETKLMASNYRVYSDREANSFLRLMTAAKVARLTPYRKEKEADTEAAE
jgi:hypothetical protein